MSPTRVRRLAPLAAVAAITALGFALRLAGLAHVRPNWFYDAAVRSMGRSWHNFFFAAFDPTGRVAVDKPPVELWLQVASVKVLGWNQLALKLPEALLGAAAVPLLYDTLRRLSGRAAGLAGAAALAVLPIAVLTARSGTMDTTATTLVLLAAWLTVLACERSRPTLLIGAAVAVGLAFNAKLFEALLPVPALALLYAFRSPAPLRRRVAHLAGAGAVLAVVSFSWLAVTSLLTPHPFPMGSIDGTTWSAALYHDGTGRGASLSGVGGPLPGAARLVARQNYGPNVGVELVPAALLGALALAGAVAARARRRGAAVLGAPRSPLAVLGAGAFALWLLLDLVAFARLRAAPPRYLAALGPPVAGCLGLAVGELVRLRRSLLVRGGLALALAAAAVYAAHVAPAHALAGTVAVVAGGLAALLAVSARGGRTFGAATVAACVAVLAVPLALSVRLVGAGESDASRLPALPGAQRAAFLRYTRAHGGGRASAVAVYNPTVLAGAIAEGAGPILPLTSWAGRPLVRLAELRAQTAAGRVRLALLGNPRCDVRPPAHPRHCLPTVSWISAHGRNVSRAAGVRPPFALYRLSPRTGRARPSPIEVRARDRIEHRLG